MNKASNEFQNRLQSMDLPDIHLNPVFYRNLKKNNILDFKPKVHIYQEKGSYILKTVTDVSELIEALKLRYQVFHREMIGKKFPWGLDVDEFDFYCDHLVIKDKDSGRIVGTYRLNCSSWTQKFYSNLEFDISNILAKPGVKTELGRACIHKNFRKGIVIALLWRGIAEYMNATDSEMVFGCASIKTTNPDAAAELYLHFKNENRLREDLDCPPTEEFTMPGLMDSIEHQQTMAPVEHPTVTELIPPLCRAYLKAGALIGGLPAYDHDFKCIDFLTILSRENMSGALGKKYNL